jgi:prepilin-type N-terminal cleavage/methylation domain-containing protein
MASKPPFLRLGGGRPRREHERMPRPAGFTLTELLFAMAVLAVVAGMCAPSIEGTLRRGAVRAASLEIAGALAQARAASITGNRRGTFCLAGASGACLEGPAAAAGWQVLVDDAGGPRVVARGNLPRGVLLVSNRASVHFWPSASAGSTATLTICDGAGRAPWRQLVVSQTGRVRSHSAPVPAGCP